jgi:DNA polymerase III delta prime subunit
MIAESIDKNNLHHAYLIEGARDEIVPEILSLFETFGINSIGNPDFVSITIDNFKIDEAFELRAMSTDKSFGTGKKIFLICANSFSLDAQNVLLKMFEEPKENTHFFLVVPDANILLKTLVSRFYFISALSNTKDSVKEAEKFIAMPLKSRVDFIKELLTDTEEEDEEGNEIIALDSNRSKALKFLNALETILEGKLVKDFEGGRFQPEAGVKPKNTLQVCLEHILKVREFLRLPGSSAKSLMESVALIIPEKI